MITYNDDNGIIIKTQMERTEDDNISQKPTFVYLSMTLTQLKEIG
jgi:hypothetical protein